MSSKAKLEYSVLLDIFSEVRQMQSNALEMPHAILLLKKNEPLSKWKRDHFLRARGHASVVVSTQCKY